MPFFDSEGKKLSESSGVNKDASEFHVVAMELVPDAQELFDLVVKSNKHKQGQHGLAENTMSMIFAQVAELLVHAKQNGLEGDGKTAIAHRDIKLENVLVFGEGPRVSVIDWGMSAVFDKTRTRPVSDVSSLEDVHEHSLNSPRSSNESMAAYDY